MTVVLNQSRRYTSNSADSAIESLKSASLSLCSCAVHHSLPSHSTWFRSSWLDTTIPVGMCVIRTADSVLLTCCPPFPLDRNKSIRRSEGRISVSMFSTSGNTATVIVDVWIRPWLSVSGTRCTRYAHKKRNECYVNPWFGSKYTERTIACDFYDSFFDSSLKLKQTNETPLQSASCSWARSISSLWENSSFCTCS